jgi:hypothetical protein
MQCGIYRHYKGGYYQVLGVAQHTETKESMVVYVALTGVDMPGPRMRTRPMYGPEGFLTPPEGADARFIYHGDWLTVVPPSEA